MSDHSSTPARRPADTSAPSRRQFAPKLGLSVKHLRLIDAVAAQRTQPAS